MRKFVLSENTIDCPSCNGDGAIDCLGYEICIDCDGEGKIHQEFWDGDYVKHKYQDLEGWIVGFDGSKAIVEILEDEKEDSELLIGTRLTFRVEELEHAKEK